MRRDAPSVLLVVSEQASHKTGLPGAVSTEHIKDFPDFEREVCWRAVASRDAELKLVRHSLSLPYSHSIVPGSFDVTSYTTRLTPLTSLMMRVAVSPRNFMSNE